MPEFSGSGGAEVHGDVAAEDDVARALGRLDPQVLHAEVGLQHLDERREEAGVVVEVGREE